MMYKLIVAGATALLVTASAPAFAQQTSANPSQYMYAPGQAHLSASDWDTLTAMRIKVVKAALQLTPEQEKYWPAIAEAMRVRAEHRQAQIGKAAEAMATAEKGNGSIIKALSERNPIEFMQRRADTLTQRAEDLKKLADAWQPLYQTLQPEQKERMAFLATAVLHGMANRVEQRLVQSEEDTEE
jgi:hypothetical protein